MKIVLFGAGENGVRALRNIGIERVFAVVDNYQFGSLCGVPIKRLKDMEAEDKDDILFLITPVQYKKEIADDLVRHGYHKFIAYTPICGASTKEALEESGWSVLYNDFLLKGVVQGISEEKFSCWTKEMIKITKRGERVLEIGCGSGSSSLGLAKHGRICTAIDYSEASIQLLEQAKTQLNLSVESFVLDARKPLPFAEKSFDVVFQAGLLEHFEQAERVDLLRLWKPVCHRMVSMIPNANSVPYRMGKELQEKAGEWLYGKELPQATMVDEFLAAGYHSIDEYTIGVEEALAFLPAEHYMRVAFERWYNHLGHTDFWGQGYLLVTIGKT